MLLGKRKLTDEQLLYMIRGTAAEREAALSYIYLASGWRAVARRILRADGASVPDAEDAIQEAVIVLDNHLRNSRYEQSASLKNYFLGICKGRWYSNRRSVRRLDWTEEPRAADAADHREPEVLMLEEEQKTIVRQMLELLDERCRELLQLYQLSYSMEEIGAALNLGSANNARQRVHQCRTKLTKMLEGLPLFEEYNHRKK